MFSNEGQVRECSPHLKLCGRTHLSNPPFSQSINRTVTSHFTLFTFTVTLRTCLGSLHYQSNTTICTHLDLNTLTLFGMLHLMVLLFIF